MFHSIRSRLTFTYLLFLALIECAQFFILYSFTSNAYTRQKEETLIHAFDEINDDTFNEPGVFEDIKAVMQDYEQTSNLYFTIYNSQNDQIIYATNDHNNVMQNFQEFKEKNADFDDMPSVHSITGDDSNKWLVLYGNIETFDNQYHVIIWTCYEAEIQNTIASLSPVALLTLLVSCAIGLILSIYISGRIVKPIKQVDKAAQNIASQNFDFVIKLPKTHDETYRLAQNISKMSDNLKKDMDTLKQVNEQLELDIKEKSRIDQMRRQFLSNVSHDLKTPLAIISSYAEMLKYEGEHINTEDYLDVILEESSQMNKMIASLLELSRLEYAADHLSLEPCNISDTLTSLLESRHILFEEHNLETTTDIEPDICVMADESYLVQAFDNYLSNAIKYSTKTQPVNISLKREQNDAVFTVENPCEPLDEEAQKDIWESFYKVDKSRKKDENMSVGLGLYIVKTIVDAHNGSYHVENTDTGVAFSIRLHILESN